MERRAQKPWENTRSVAPCNRLNGADGSSGKHNLSLKLVAAPHSKKDLLMN